MTNRELVIHALSKRAYRTGEYVVRATCLSVKEVTHALTELERTGRVITTHKGYKLAPTPGAERQRAYDERKRAGTRTRKAFYLTDDEYDLLERTLEKYRGEHE
jgi:biotin operon repressor